MKMMCKLKRPAGTQVTLGDVTYDFQPDQHGRHVCQVDREDHQDIFLGIPEGYRPLVEDAESIKVEGTVPVASQTLMPGGTGEDDDEDEDESNDGETSGDDSTPDPDEQEPEAPVDDELDLEALNDEELAKVYVEVMGKKPNANAKRDTLINHIVEKASEE